MTEAEIYLVLAGAAGGIIGLALGTLVVILVNIWWDKIGRWEK